MALDDLSAPFVCLFKTSKEKSKMSTIYNQFPRMFAEKMLNVPWSRPFLTDS